MRGLGVLPLLLAGSLAFERGVGTWWGLGVAVARTGFGAVGLAVHSMVGPFLVCRCSRGCPPPSTAVRGPPGAASHHKDMVPGMRCAPLRRC